MNALRLFITTPDSDTLEIPLPKDFQKRRVEVIVIDIEDEPELNLPLAINTPEDRLP